jgi:hypothetical protein
MLKEKEVTGDSPTKTVHHGSSEEAVDVDIMRIMKEKQPVSGASDDAKVVRNRASNDVEDTERVEV